MTDTVTISPELYAHLKHTSGLTDHFEGEARALQDIQEKIVPTYGPQLFIWNEGENRVRFEWMGDATGEVGMRDVIPAMIWPDRSPAYLLPEIAADLFRAMPWKLEPTRHERGCTYFRRAEAIYKDACLSRNRGVPVPPPSGFEAQGRKYL